MREHNMPIDKPPGRLEHTQSKVPELPSIPENHRVEGWGWMVAKPSLAAVRTMRGIPTYADMRKAQVLDGLKVVEAAEVLVNIKGDNRGHR
jgi:hypothetical protein